MPIYEFFKDMSGYVLLAVGPYVAYIFQRRSRFVDVLQEEWRKIVIVKRDVLTYCELENADVEKFLEVYGRLSVAIDQMRVLFCNVGASRSHVGYYPFETLHDFRKTLESLDPRRGSVSGSKRIAASSNVNANFEAFRDVFLIELSPIEPDYPIIRRNVKRQRADGVNSKDEKRVVSKDAATMTYFGVDGSPRRIDHDQ